MALPFPRGAGDSCRSVAFLHVTGLHYACMKNNWWTVSRLLQVPGVDITARDNRGATPAYWAVANNSVECLAILARDLTVDWWNYRSISGKTPLYVAIFHGHVEIVKILLQIQDQDFYVKTDDGDSLALLAVRNENKVTSNY